MFYAELEKIAADEGKGIPPAIQAILAGALGAGIGHAGVKHLYPYLMQLAKRPVSPPGMLSLPMVLGESAGATLGVLGWEKLRRKRDHKKRVNRRKNRKGKRDVSDNKQLAERHEGSSDKVPEGVLLSERFGGVPVSTGKGPIYGGDGGRGDRADDNRRGHDPYGYTGKKTRHHRF